MGAPRIRSRVAPRLRFSEKDQEPIRFISAKHGRILSTVIIDISETGVGFLTSMNLAPRVGEFIKMDFAPLGTVRMACQGRVVHVQTPPANTGWNKFPGTVKVGVQFFDLPPEYRRLLAKTLKDAFTKSGRSFNENEDYSVHANDRTGPTWFKEHMGSIVVGTLIIAAVVFGIYYFVVLDPTELDSSPKDPGWATNFFEKAIKK